MYKYVPIIEKNLGNIYKDYKDSIAKEINVENFKKKYLSFGDHTNKILENVINDQFHLYEYEDNSKTLNYFNSLCFWYLYHIITITQQPFIPIENYINLYEKIVNNKILNNIDRIKFIITFMTVLLEEKNNLDCPKFFFYDELAQNNPYKIAYDFQYKIIDNITEDSCLFQPFLFLDSYIMDNIYRKSFKFVQVKKPAYSISMLTLELIKTHLKKSIKNYFFVLEKKMH